MYQLIVSTTRSFVVIVPLMLAAFHDNLQPLGISFISFRCSQLITKVILKFISKGMASTDLKSCSTENAGKFLNKEGKPASGDASRLESTSYLNGNSVKTTAHEVVSSTTEPLAENKGSDVKKERVGMEISRKEEEEKCGTTVEARSGHEKERHQQESELFSKRKLVNSLKLSTYKCLLRSC